MLSGPLSTPSRPRPRAPAAAVRFWAADGGVGFLLAREACVALAEGALWLPDRATLIVSDVHMEKGSAFAARGQLLPPYDTRSALRRLEILFERLSPKRLVSLGDGFHDARAGERIAAADRAALKALTAACDWIWIEGNHDPAPPPGLGGRAMAELALGGLLLRHAPVAGEAPGEVAGHLHPCARIAGRARSVRARCFATDGARLVMPAFGAYAGGLNVCDPAFAPLFPRGLFALATGRGKVHPVAGDRLLAHG